MTTSTYLAAAGALALAACFPVVALAGGNDWHGDWNGRQDHDGNGRNGWDYGRGHGDWDNQGSRFAYGRGYGGGWYPGYGAYVAPRYAYPRKCFDPVYGWYPCHWGY